jgi:diguanylate cyclase (GGDEF)-like protein
MNELVRFAGAILSASDTAQLEDALVAAVHDLVPATATWRLSLVASGQPDTMRSLATLAGDGRRVSVSRLPDSLQHEVHHLPYVFASPLRSEDRSGVQTTRGALLVGAASADVLAALEPSLSTLAALAGAALDRLTLAAEIDRTSRDGFFRTLVMKASDVVLIVEPDDLRVRFASPSAAEVFGTPHLVGAELPTLLAPGSEAETRRLLERLCAGQITAEAVPDGDRSNARPTLDWTIIRPNGPPAQVAVTCLDLRHDPTVAGLAISMRDVTHQRKVEAELTFQAFYDDLTGLPNRALFRDRLTQAVARAHRSKGIVGVLFIDLDDFKIVNDTLGHDTGDELLRMVAERLVSGLRPGDTAARLGGDEFAVIIEETRSDDAVEDVAQRVVAIMREPFSLGGHTVSGRASVGVATTAEAPEIADLLRQADLALYAAKGDGKGQWRRHDPDRWHAILDRLELRAVLDEAVRNHEFSLVYQPIVSLADRRTVGLEALVRWNHPERGILLPDRFIDVAEESDTILALGGWIAHKAIDTAAQWWHRLGEASAPYVSINVSARQFRAKDFTWSIREALADSGLPGDRLMIELNETLLLHDGPKVLDDLINLRKEGVMIAVDDFGTGYSALSYLRDVPLDVLKLDEAFTGGLRDQDASLIEGIIKLAHTIDLKVIAEGIERPGQFQMLVNAGCEYGQGFEICRPMDSSAAFQWIASAR